MSKKHHKFIFMAIFTILILLTVGCNNKTSTYYLDKNHNIDSVQNIKFPQDAVARGMQIQSADGTLFELYFDKNQCGIPRSCKKDDKYNCMEIPLQEFLYTSKDGKHMIPVMAVSVPGSGCPSFVIRDDAENSTCYCSGGRCWCPTR